MTEVARIERELRRALRSTTTGSIEPALAIAFGLAAWYLVAVFVPHLPMPPQVIVSAVALLTTGSSYTDFGLTLRRMGIGLSGGFLLGAAIGIAMGAQPVADGFFRPWVVLGLAIPEAVLIISCILLIGIQESSLMIALIIAITPYVATVTNAGMKAIDPRLIEMSEVFHAGWRQKWVDVILPQTVPALFAGLRTGFALSWKLVVVLEALAASRGVGEAMLFSFQELDTAQMIAWGLILSLVMWLVEVQVFRRVERRASRWRI
ncbi:MAG: ABC transporter permease [Candidatus Acidiferrales bacterium]